MNSGGPSKTWVRLQITTLVLISSWKLLTKRKHTSVDKFPINCISMILHIVTHTRLSHYLTLQHASMPPVNIKLSSPEQLHKQTPANSNTLQSSITDNTLNSLQSSKQQVQDVQKKTPLKVVL